MSKLIIKRRLTKHGRARFVERIGFMSDKDIITTATIGLVGYQFIWKPDNKCRT